MKVTLLNTEHFLFLQCLIKLINNDHYFVSVFSNSRNLIYNIVKQYLIPVAQFSQHFSYDDKKVRPHPSFACNIFGDLSSNQCFDFSIDHTDYI
ncbi:hypothetical protein T09_15812 [Trichinella sp. T9]|nr:hypothetical protein T09_15812 [Trichinella sp. T9]